MGIKLRNVMEDVITEKLEAVIDTLECCKCDRCKMDIVAYTLNHVPPKYALTDEGKIMSLLSINDQQIDADLTKVIVQASKIVAEKPHH